MFKVYGVGDLLKCPTQNEEVTNFFENLAIDYPQLRKMAIHIKKKNKNIFIPTYREKIEAIHEGFANIIILGKITFVCKLKSRSIKTKLTIAEKEFLSLSNHAGAFSCLAYGYQAALQAVKDWNSA